MNLNTKYFITVAQELNISQAAKKLYISQQSLSQHIQRMEKKYGVLLFYRKPKFALTPAGERMLKTLQQIQQLEQSLYEGGEEGETEVTGTVRLTMAESRLKTVMPPVVERFSRRYPKLTLEVHGYSTQDSERMLMDGEIDMFVGVNPTRHPQLESVLLQRETLRIVARPEVLRRYIPDFDSRREEFEERGIPLREVGDMPMIFVHRFCVVGQQVEQFLSYQDLQLNEYFRSNNSELHLMLCAENDAACFCLDSHLNILPEVAERHHVELLDFPIRDYPYVNDVRLVRYRHAISLPQLDELAEIIIETYGNTSEHQFV